MESLATPLVQFILLTTLGSAVWLFALMALDRRRAESDPAQTAVRDRAGEAPVRAKVTSIDSARRLPKAA